MSNSLTRLGSKLALGLVLTAGVGGCAHERHHRHPEAAVAAYGVTEPVYVDGVAVIDDPDPFIVERERFYLDHPRDIRIVNEHVYYRGELIRDPREARAIRLAARAHEAHEARRVRHVTEAEHPQGFLDHRIEPVSHGAHGGFHRF